MTNLLSRFKRENLNVVDSRLYDFLNEHYNQISTVWMEFFVYLLQNCSSTSTYSRLVKELGSEKFKEKFFRLTGVKTSVEPFYYCEFLGIKKDLEVVKYFYEVEPLPAAVAVR